MTASSDIGGLIQSYNPEFCMDSEKKMKEDKEQFLKQ